MASNTYDGVTLSEMGLAYSIPVFYSTNVWVKFFIAERYRRRHYVWCSEGFDISRQHIQGMPKPPRNSSPCDIYRERANGSQNGSQGAFV